MLFPKIGTGLVRIRKDAWFPNETPGKNRGPRCLHRYDWSYLTLKERDVCVHHVAIIVLDFQTPIEYGRRRHGLRLPHYLLLSVDSVIIKTTALTLLHRLLLLQRPRTRRIWFRICETGPP